ncbi:MAG: hypothetical protein O2901_02770 [Verrucomicrobia bacterium]|nr:hypothetical protein [Verrucomicrobiota bacterium]
MKESGGTPLLLWGEARTLGWFGTALLVTALLVPPARAIAEDTATTPPPTRTFNDVKDQLNAMVAEERESVKKSREMVAGISRLGVRELKIRDRILAADPQLKALSKSGGDAESGQERGSREKILERRLREKSEVLASMMDEKQALIDEHAKLQLKINDLRQQKDSLFEEVRPKGPEKAAGASNAKP